MKFHKFTFISSSHTDKERFNSRGQHQWKFIAAKEEKSSSIGLALLLFWNTNMAAVTSWENAQQTNSQSDQLPVSLLAQLVERCSGITEVVGSNPGRSSLSICGICLISQPGFGILKQNGHGMRDAENDNRDYGIERKFRS